MNGALRSYTVSPTSIRLMAIAGSGLDRSYTYYPTGQVKTITGPLSTLTGAPQAPTAEIFRNGFESGEASSTWQFSYDRANRLGAITDPGLDASYTIAATGMRAAKTVNGNTTRFVYGLDGQLLHEHDLHSSRKDQHLYLHGRPIALIRNNAVYWAHTDHLGRPEVLANSTGTIVWRAIPQAFTRSVITDTIGGHNVGFPGQYHDEETGFAYNIHRDYDPVTGRYLQSDPIGLNGGTNTYAYVGGNPVGQVDPLGLAGCIVGWYGYPISIPGIKEPVPLVHAGVLSYNDTGQTRYYEYGRYGDNFGAVRRQPVPDISLDKNGDPTAESWDRLLERLDDFGKGRNTTVNCYKSSDADKINNFAESRMNNPNRRPYSLNPILPNTCTTFAKEAVIAGHR